MGFILDSTSYLKDNWNRLDFTVVMVRPANKRSGSWVGPSFSRIRGLRVFWRRLHHIIALHSVAQFPL